CAPVTHVNRKHLRVIAGNSARFNGFGQPLGNQALGEFALRIFEAESRPFPSRIEQPLELQLIHLIVLGAKMRAAHASVEPETYAYAHFSAFALLIEGEKKVHGMSQVRTLAQKSLPLAQGFAHQS